MCTNTVRIIPIRPKKHLTISMMRLVLYDTTKQVRHGAFSTSVNISCEGKYYGTVFEKTFAERSFVGMQKCFTCVWWSQTKDKNMERKKSDHLSDQCSKNKCLLQNAQGSESSN